MDDTTTTTTPPPTEITPRSQGRAWSIPQDAVIKATIDLPEDQRDAIRWLNQYGATSGHSIAEIAQLITKPSGEAYSQHSLWAVLSGRRAAEGVSVEKMVESINQFRRRVEETGARLSGRFVETAMTRRIHEICRKAFFRKRLAFVIGSSQIGKTAALAEYQRRHNHGETHMFRMSALGSVASLVDEMAGHFGIGRHCTGAKVLRRVLDCYDERCLVIIDEVHQAMTRGGINGKTIEFLRELYDRRGCGMVLCGTDVFADHLRTDAVLAQLWRRRSPGLVIRLPSVPTDADLAEFSRAVGLGEAPDQKMKVSYRGIDPQTAAERSMTFTANPKELQNTICRSQGLGSWCKLLEDAAAQATEDKRPITWGRVLLAYCLAEAMETY
jgi:DNA transposition AAA+ family ATPase